MNFLHIQKDYFIVVIWYLIILNLSTFIVYFVDKKRAIKHKWRIPEKTLIGLSAIGGSLGALCSMKIFRHKTKHTKFLILNPLFFIVHIILFVLIILN